MNMNKNKSFKNKIGIILLVFGLFGLVAITIYLMFLSFKNLGMTETRFALTYWKFIALQLVSAFLAVYGKVLSEN